MKKSGSTIFMMEMCVQTCCMCIISCAKVSDMFSISEVNSYAAPIFAE